MTIAQTRTAINTLEAQGHKFKLLASGQLHVTNVTPPVRAFCTRFKADIMTVLAGRQQEQLAKANFPGGSVVVERHTWADIRKSWADFVAKEGLDRFLELRILSRTVSSLQGEVGEDAAIRMLAERWDEAPKEILEQLIDFQKAG